MKYVKLPLIATPARHLTALQKSLGQSHSWTDKVIKVTILLDITNNFKDWLSCDWNSLSDFFLWLVQGMGYLFVLMIIWMLIALIRMMFQRNETGRELRECGKVHLCIFGIPCVIALCIGLYNREKKDIAPHSFVSTSYPVSNNNDDSRPWSGNHLDKENINDVGWDDTVFICTSGSSKRFHSTLACPGMQNCMDGEDAITREEAEDLGRTHCLRCYYEY